jgi:cell division protease FtsH
MDKKTRFHFIYVVIALMGVSILHDLWVAYRSVETIPYSEFQRLVREKKIAELVVSDDAIEGTLKTPEDGKKRFVTTRVGTDIADELDKYGITYSGRVKNTFFTTLLSWILPALVFVGVWALLQRRLFSGGPGATLMSIGKSKAKVFVEHDTKVSFKDVAGVDEAKAELQEVVAFLKAPASYGRLGARMPKGVLLVGPPGTGKTLLARAVAGEAGVPFFSISGSEFVEMFVGVGAARVRDLFEQARSKAPCIIFIDELDALGRARGAFQGMGGHDEKEQTLNQLLVELDGCDPSSGIVLLAATNRPEVLDPALLRAGRFDRQVLVDRPDRVGRAAILSVHLQRVQLAADVEPDQVAALTPGFTGADLANLVNEAALVATRRGATLVEMADFTSAIERIVAGLEKKNRLLVPRESRVVAHHEMGHALVATALPGCDPVHKVSIIPRGIGALGYTIQRPTDDRYLMTRIELENKVAVLLGGRAAEHLVFQQLSTGAADDLAQATHIAMTMVTRYAMAPELGNLTYDTDPPTFLATGAAAHGRTYSEETAREIDCAARAIVDSAFARARDVLARNRQVLLDAAATLLEKESLGGDELGPFLDRVVKEPPRVSVA